MNGACGLGPSWIRQKQLQGGNVFVQCLKSSSVGSFYIYILQSALQFAKLSPTRACSSPRGGSGQMVVRSLILQTRELVPQEWSSD